jgi:3-phytase
MNFTNTLTVFESYSLKIFFIIFVLAYSGFPQTSVITPVIEFTASGIADQDDMCIWLHPTDKSLSIIIASDKTADKIFVYDLNGIMLQTIDISGYQPGNIDLRYGFMLAGQSTDIVGFNRRSGNTLVFYKIDPATRQLIPAGSFPSGSNYGFCLYKSPVTQKYYAFSSDESSNISQYEISDNNSDGLIEGALVRSLDNGSAETEGMVADDETGILYAANENAGIYKYDAEPTGSLTGQLIAAVGSNGLTADVEGLTIFYESGEDGYLIASSQGNNTFKIFTRETPHNFVKTIQVSGVGNTDGIDVTNVNLNSEFQYGLFLIHDGTGSPYVIRGCRWEDTGLVEDTVSFQFSMPVNDGWNMVAVPGLHPINQDISTWWSGLDPSASVFMYDGGYQSVLSVTPGRGYWMKHIGNQIYNTGDEWPAGGILRVPNTSFNGHEGWNLIGAFENEVAVSSLTTTPTGLITGSIFKFDNGYHAIDTLHSGYAYWIKLSQAGLINFPSQNLNSLKKD